MPDKRECGPCSLCCKVMAVPVIHKSANAWCQDCTKPGCGIYEERPKPCREFECLWVQRDVLSQALRPDRCHVVFATSDDGKTLVAHVDRSYPLAYREKVVWSMLQRVAKDLTVVIIIGDQRIKLGGL